MSISQWTAVPDPEAAEADIKALNAAATKSKDSAAQAAVKQAAAKYVAWKKAFTQASGDTNAKKTAANTAVGGPTVTAYNNAVTKVNSAAEADSAGPTKFSVKGNMPAQPQNMPDTASYDKAKVIYTQMKAGKNPKAAAKLAGINEDPSIIPAKNKKSGVYHFRLSHGGTQYRLDATYEVKGDTTEVKFTGVGRGH